MSAIRIVTVIIIVAVLTCVAAPVVAQTEARPVIATRDFSRVAGLTFIVSATAPRLSAGLVPSASVAAPQYHRSSMSRRLLVGALVGFAAGAVVGAAKACDAAPDRESYCAPAVVGLGAGGAVLGVLVAFNTAP